MRCSDPDCLGGWKVKARGLCSRCYNRHWARGEFPRPTDYDEFNVESQIWGMPTALTRTERVEVVRRYTAQGLSARQIAALVGTTSRQVQRDRSAAPRLSAAS